MIERPVRDLHSEKRIPPLFCKVIVCGMKVICKCVGMIGTKVCIKAANRKIHNCHLPCIRIGFLTIN